MPCTKGVLPAATLPIGQTLLLLLLPLLTRRRWPLLLAFALLNAASTPLVARAPMRAVAGGQEHGSLAAGVDAAETDAIVVLNSRRPVALSADGGAVSEWTVADRFLAGIALARADAAPWLVVSGG